MEQFIRTAKKGIFRSSDFQFQERDMIGSGAYGSVYKGKLKGSQDQVAIKRLHNLPDADIYDIFIKEINQLGILSFPTISSLYGITVEEPYYIITEYMPYTLTKVLTKQPKGYGLTQKYIEIFGIANAMLYLHRRQIAHLDLKPQNVLLDAKFYPRLCDFGVSKTIATSIRSGIKEPVGTIGFQAPEVMTATPEHGFEPFKADVFSFAMTTYCILTDSEHPFTDFISSGLPSQSIAQAIIGGRRPEFEVDTDIPPEMIALVTRCWDTNPNQRLTFIQIVDFLRQFISTNPNIKKAEFTTFLKQCGNPNEDLPPNLARMNQIWRQANDAFRAENYDVAKDLYIQTIQLDPLKITIPLQAFLLNPIVLQLFEPAQQQPEAKYKVYVRNLPFRVYNDELKAVFSQFGPVVEAYVVLQKNERGKYHSKGYGFVAFADEQSMKKAKKASGKLTIDDRKLSIQNARF